MQTFLLQICKVRSSLRRVDFEWMTSSKLCGQHFYRRLQRNADGAKFCPRHPKYAAPRQMPIFTGVNHWRPEITEHQFCQPQLRVSCRQSRFSLASEITERHPITSPYISYCEHIENSSGEILRVVLGAWM